MIRDVLGNIDDYAIWLTAVVGGLVALGWLGKRARAKFARMSELLVRIDVAVTLAEHELRPNSGSSLYDKIGRISSGVDALWESVDTLSERFESQLATQAEASRAMWPAVEAIANAQPHDTDR